MVTQLVKVKLGFEPKSPWLQRAYISVLRKVLKIDIKWSLCDLRAGQCVQSLRLVLVSLAGDAGQGLETSHSSVQPLQPVMDPCGHLLAGPAAEKHPFGGSSAKASRTDFKEWQAFLCLLCLFPHSLGADRVAPGRSAVSILPCECLRKGREVDRLVDHCHFLVSAFPFQPCSARIGPSDFQGHGQGFADLSVVWGLPCAVNWHRLKLAWIRFLLPLYVPRVSSLQIVLAPEVPLLTLQTQPSFLPQLHFGALLDRFCPWLPVPPCSGPSNSVQSACPSLPAGSPWLSRQDWKGYSGKYTVSPTGTEAWLCSGAGSGDRIRYACSQV